MFHISSENGLLSDDTKVTKPLPELMLTYFQLDLLERTSEEV